MIIGLWRSALCVAVFFSCLACATDRAASIPTSAKVAVPTRTAETELQALARIEHELELIKVSVREAQSSARGTRLQFDYDQLRLDLDRIRMGIREHRLGELNEPRAIEPLSGDYR